MRPPVVTLCLSLLALQPAACRGASAPAADSDYQVEADGRAVPVRQAEVYIGSPACEGWGQS